MANRNFWLSLFSIAITVTTALGQTKEGAINQKSERSICSDIVALTGDVKLTCSNLSDSQKKAISAIPGILKMALSNQEYLKSIEAKLDELAKTPTAPATINYAPQGISISGGTVTSPTVNNYGPPEPKIEGIEYIPSDPAADFKGHPLTTIKFHLSANPISQRFFVLCDRPCTAGMAGPIPRNMWSSSDMDTFEGTGNPSIAGWQINRHIEAGQEISVSVTSKDDQPARILRISQKL